MKATNKFPFLFKDWDYNFRNCLEDELPLVNSLYSALTNDLKDTIELEQRLLHLNIRIELRF